LIDVSGKLRETSNKALNAINEIQLIPFLMGFLEHRDRLPGRVVAAAGGCHMRFLVKHIYHLSLTSKQHSVYTY
jgi:hypothetical protein